MRISDWSSDVCSSDLKIIFTTSMKRARTTKGASLTGGTGDFNPQTYSITIGNNGVDGRNTAGFPTPIPRFGRSEEHTSELQSLMRISYAVFCLKKKNKSTTS